MKKVVCVCVLAGLTLSLALAAAPATGPINDDAIYRQMQAAAEKLQADKSTLRQAELIKQLTRKTCRVALPPAPVRTITPANFYDQLKPSVLVVGSLYKCPKCAKWHLTSAGAWVLAADGVCVTNYHVVDEPKNELLVAMTADGKVAAVKEVLAASKADDVAIVRIDATGLTPLALAPRAAVGSHVRLISHPDLRFYAMSEGIISRYFLTRGRRRGDPAAPAMSITADFAKGSSGSPVLDDQGRVVGMVAATESIYYDDRKGHQENLQMVIKQCVPAESILKLVETPAQAGK